jgi:hypothetical protein
LLELLDLGHNEWDVQQVDRLSKDFGSADRDNPPPGVKRGLAPRFDDGLRPHPSRVAHRDR